MRKSLRIGVLHILDVEDHFAVVLVLGQEQLPVEGIKIVTECAVLVFEVDHLFEGLGRLGVHPVVEFDFAFEGQGGAACGAAGILCGISYGQVSGRFLQVAENLLHDLRFRRAGFAVGQIDLFEVHRHISEEVDELRVEIRAQEERFAAQPVLDVGGRDGYFVAVVEPGQQGVGA